MPKYEIRLGSMKFECEADDVSQNILTGMVEGYIRAVATTIDGQPAELGQKAVHTPGRTVFLFSRAQLNAVGNYIRELQKPELITSAVSVAAIQNKEATRVLEDVVAWLRTKGAREGINPVQLATYSGLADDIEDGSWRS